MRRILAFSFFAIAACQVHAGGIPVDTLKKLKAASVYIKMEFNVPGGKGKSIPTTGSGFVLRADGETGYIVTNNHVISPPREIPGLVAVAPITLVFHSGTPMEKSVTAELAATDPFRDLAILKVSGVKDLPAAIALDSKVEIIETMTVFAFGFPFGGALATGKRNPTITVTRGTVSSLRLDDKGNVHLVQIDAEINPGNSGGPIVDDKGNLVGIAVSKLLKGNLGFAIPVKPLTDMVLGKVAHVSFDTANVVDGDADVLVEASLLDPMARLKSVTLHHAAGKPDKAPEPDKEGNYPLLKGASKIELTIEKGKGTGKLRLAGKGKGKQPLTYQAEYVNGDGKRIVSAPFVADIDFTQVVIEGKLSKDDPLDALKKQPHQAFERRLEMGKHYVIEMRADVKVLAPYLRLEDAAGTNLLEDANSGWNGGALIVFAPPVDGPYKIIATTSRGLGDFTLRIREDSGLPIPRGGLARKGKLLGSDPLDKLLNAPAQAFNVVFKKNTLYTIDMRSTEFDSFLRVENMAGLNVAADDDSGGELNARAIFMPSQDGIFKVIATSFDKNTGDYSLTIREGGALEVPPLGLKVAGGMLASDPLDPTVPKEKNARCKTFDLRLQAGQRYQIDMVSPQFDCLLRIEDAKGKELARDDNSGGMTNARLVFTPPADGSYRIFATAIDGRLGQFALLIVK